MSAAERSFQLAPQLKENKVPPELHQSSWIADRVIDAIRAAEGKPFCYWCSFVDPHHPFDAPEPYASMYDPSTIPLPARREGEMRDKPPHFDEMVRGLSPGQREVRALPRDGRRLAGAARQLLRDGQPHRRQRRADPRCPARGRRLRRHHRPLHLRPRGAARRSRPAVQGTVPLRPAHPGVAHRAVGGTPSGAARGSAASRSTRTSFPRCSPAAVYRSRAASRAGRCSRSSRATRTPATSTRWSSTTAATGACASATLRSRRWRFTWYGGRRPGELYDLAADPDEFQNLWQDPSCRETRGELEDRLLDRLLATGDTAQERQSRY